MRKSRNGFGNQQTCDDFPKLHYEKNREMDLVTNRHVMIFPRPHYPEYLNTLAGWLCGLPKAVRYLQRRGRATANRTRRTSVVSRVLRVCTKHGFDWKRKHIRTHLVIKTVSRMFLIMQYGKHHPTQVLELFSSCNLNK